jgi:hypothetical protein
VIPPLFIRIRIQRFGLWFPLFVLWPILLALWLVVLPLLLVWATITARLRWGWAMIRIGPAFYMLLCAFRGTHIDVRDDRNTVRISIW